MTFEGSKRKNHLYSGKIPILLAELDVSNLDGWEVLENLEYLLKGFVRLR